MSDGPEGLALDALHLVPHDPRWSGWYAAEAARLAQLPGLVRIAHIGSTSMPDVPAKPVIDTAVQLVDPGLPSVARFLADRGYCNHGDYGLPGRIFFTRGDPPCFHLHVVGEESPHWSAWLRFRDALLADPSLRRAYGDEKVRLLHQCSGDRRRYTREKSSFIQRVLAG
ncbi:MAG TPA: GrpB family protein [Kiritimatiellia bacterium]|nr:GrpB family protein [Kiritimatiellia bacterium]HMP34323.1 GrpB family protein [Kiritimatiellia bacterium]